MLASPLFSRVDIKWLWGLPLILAQAHPGRSPRSTQGSAGGSSRDSAENLSMGVPQIARLDGFLIEKTSKGPIGDG